MSENPVSDAIRSTGIPALLDTTRVFAEKIFGPAAEEAGELLRDHIRGFRFRNQAAIIERARQFAESSGRDVGRVPIRTLAPLLDAAGFEDEPSIQELWAALLASASTDAVPGATRPAFVEVLKQVSPTEVAILERYFVRYGIPRAPTHSVSRRQVVGELSERFGRPEVDVGTSNLLRLGLITAESSLRDAVDSLLRGLLDASRGSRSGDRRSPWSQFSSSMQGKRGAEETLNLTPMGFHFLFAVAPPICDEVPLPPDASIRELRWWWADARQVARYVTWDTDLRDAITESGDRARSLADQLSAADEKSE